jgi:ABC-type Na+ efflux pump permease subunit
MIIEVVKFDIRRSAKELFTYCLFGVVALVAVLGFVFNMDTLDSSLQQNAPKIEIFLDEGVLSSDIKENTNIHVIEDESDGNVVVERSGDKFLAEYDKGFGEQLFNALNLKSINIDANNKEWILTETESTATEEIGYSLAVFIWSLGLIVVATPVAFINKLVVEEIRNNQMEEMLALPFPAHKYIVAKIISLLLIGMTLAIVAGAAIGIGGVGVISMVVWNKLGDTVIEGGETISEQYEWSSSEEVFMDLGTYLLGYDWVTMAGCVMILMALFICYFVLLNVVFSDQQSYVKMGERLIFLTIVSPIPLYTYGIIEQGDAYYVPMYNVFDSLVVQTMGGSVDWSGVLLSNLLFLISLVAFGASYIKRNTYYKN